RAQPRVPRLGQPRPLPPRRARLVLPRRPPREGRRLLRRRKLFHRRQLGPEGLRRGRADAGDARQPRAVLPPPRRRSTRRLGPARSRPPPPGRPRGGRSPPAPPRSGRERLVVPSRARPTRAGRRGGAPGPVMAGLPRGRGARRAGAGPARTRR